MRSLVCKVIEISRRLYLRELRTGDALALPFPDGQFDRAFCVDTLEWVKDPLKGLEEIHRVLKPFGSAVVVHSDFDTQVFRCNDKGLCRTIVHAFSDSGPHGQLGRDLYHLCKRAKFQTIRPLAYTLINTEWLPSLYGYKVAHMMVDWLTKTRRVTEGELVRWLARRQDLQPIIESRGLDLLPTDEDRKIVQRATRLDSFLTQPFH